MTEDELEDKLENEAIRRELRYMNPENIAADFPFERERAAIAAVFEWLSLNGVCAWEEEGRGTYSTTAHGKAIHRKIGTSDAIVLSDEQYELARAVLLPPEKP